jgi:hypothetical protein
MAIVIENSFWEVGAIWLIKKNFSSKIGFLSVFNLEGGEVVIYFTAIARKKGRVVLSTRALL